MRKACFHMAVSRNTVSLLSSDCFFQTVPARESFSIDNLCLCRCLSAQFLLPFRGSHRFSTWDPNQECAKTSRSPCPKDAAHTNLYSKIWTGGHRSPTSLPTVIFHSNPPPHTPGLTRDCHFLELHTVGVRENHLLNKFLTQAGPCLPGETTEAPTLPLCCGCSFYCSTSKGSGQ